MFENSSKLAISHLFADFTPFFHTFFKIFFHHIIRLLNCYKNIYGLRKFFIENSSKLAISHLFWRFNTFFSHLFQFLFSSYNPLKCYKNIYDLRGFYMKNSYILAISHLFLRFRTFFSHLFPIVFLLCTSPQWFATFKKKSRAIPKRLHKFCPVTRFVTTTTDDGRQTTDDTWRRLGSQYPEWTKSLRLKIWPGLLRAT